MAKQRLNNDQNAEVYFNSDIGTEVAIGYKTIGPTYYDGQGITRTNSTTLTVTVAGWYYISFQQLINPTATQGYFSCRKNGSNLSYGYLMASRMADYGNHRLVLLAVGDTIQLHLDVAITTSWAAGHSDFSMYLIRRTA
jgi:hypothetical protein